MNKKLIFLLLLLLTMFLNLVNGQTHTGSWGDQGNGTYINPVLNADYSDPDIIRVDNKYYMVCSEFHFMGMPVLESDDMVNFVKAHNTLTQKVMGTTGEAITEMDMSNFAEGQKAGLCSMGGKITNLIGILKKDGQLYLFIENNGKTISEKIIKSKKIYFKVRLNIKGDKNQFFYSMDNKTFTASGESFTTSAGYWKGTRIGLFSFNELNDGGSAAFNWFSYNYDGPKAK